MLKTAIFALLLFPTSLIAQSYFSANFGGSYGSGIFKNSVETFINTKQEGNTYHTENKKFTLGGGVGILGDIQFHFQENFSLGLGFSNQFNNEEVFVEVNGVSGIISTTTQTISAKRFSVRPFIQINTDFEKFNTYFQMGVSFNSTKQKLNVLIEVDTLRTISNWEYTGKSKMGFFAVWGLSYNLSEHIMLNLGVSIEGYQYTPEHNYLQDRKLNGHSASLSSLPEINKSVDFVDWVSDQYNQYPDPNHPLQSPKQTFTYHNISVLFSVGYRF